MNALISQIARLVFGDRANSRLHHLSLNMIFHASPAMRTK